MGQLSSVVEWLTIAEVAKVFMFCTLVKVYTYWREKMTLVKVKIRVQHLTTFLNTKVRRQTERTNICGSEIKNWLKSSKFYFLAAPQSIRTLYFSPHQQRSAAYWLFTWFPKTIFDVGVFETKRLHLYVLRVPCVQYCKAPAVDLFTQRCVM